MNHTEKLVQEAKRVLESGSLASDVPTNKTFYIFDFMSGKAEVTRDYGKAMGAAERVETYVIDPSDGVQYMRRGKVAKIGKFPFYLMSAFAPKARGVRTRADARDAVDFDDSTYALDIQRGVLMKPKLQKPY